MTEETKPKMWVTPESQTLEEIFASPEGVLVTCTDCYDAWEEGGHVGSMKSLTVYGPPSAQPCKHLAKYVADLVAAGKCSPEFAARCAKEPSDAG